MRETLADGDLDLYLAVVEALAAEGFEMAEIAAAAAQLARDKKPLEVVLEREAVAPPEDGMGRLLIDTGRRSDRASLRLPSWHALCAPTD